MGDQVIDVLCYSGFSYAERPEAILWQGKKINIKQCVQSRHTPDGKSFEVILENGWKVQLHYLEKEDRWIVSGII